jgi:hypothetical protein
MKKILFCTSALLVFAALPAHAASKYITSPNVSESFGLKNRGSYEWDNDQQNLWRNKIDGEYGINNHFKVGIAADIRKLEDESMEYSSTDLKATYRFTDDSSSLQAAVQGTYSVSHEDDGADSIDAKLMLAGAAYGLDHKANVTLSHEVGDNSDDGIEANFAWGSYYDMGEFDIGGEYYGDFGNLEDNNSWSEQEHHIGPVVGFDIPVGERTVATRVGYLVGLTDDSRDNVVKYEMATKF